MYGQFYILSRTAIVGVLVKMCQDCNTTIFIFVVFVVSLTPSVKCSVFYINNCGFSTQPHFSQSNLSNSNSVVFTRHGLSEVS